MCHSLCNCLLNLLFNLRIQGMMKNSTSNIQFFVANLERKEFITRSNMSELFKWVITNTFMAMKAFLTSDKKNVFLLLGQLILSIFCMHMVMATFSNQSHTESPYFQDSNSGKVCLDLSLSWWSDGLMLEARFFVARQECLHRHKGVGYYPFKNVKLQVQTCWTL